AHGRAEVPQDRLAAGQQQRVADHLVAERTTDPRLRGVPDVVEVEQQKGSAAAGLERRLGPAEPVVTQPREVDAVLVVHGHLTGRAQRAHTGRARAGTLERAVPGAGIDVSHWYPSGCCR